MPGLSTTENPTIDENGGEDDFEKPVGEMKEKSKEKKIIIEDEPPNVTDESGWLDILGSGELKKRILKPGDGIDSRPERNNWVTINLTESLDDGTMIETVKDFKFILGDCEVVQGLDVSIALMETNEVAEIVVPPRLAYGKVGKLPDILPNSTIHYQVELLNVEEAEEEKSLPYEERLRIGNGKRERGNFWYSRGDFSNSIHCYRRALEFIDEEEEVLENDLKKHEELVQMRLKVYNNLTAAQLKIEAFDAAAKSVDIALQLQPDNVKALFRKGKILGAKGNLEEAIKLLRKALKLEPETKIIHLELSKLLQKKKSEDQTEKDMYRKMFSQTSEPVIRKTKTKQLYLYGVILSSALIAVLSVLVYYYSG